VSDFDLLTPGSPEEAIALLRSEGSGGAVALAGGTDLLFDLEEQRVRPRKVVSLRRLPWRTLEWEGSSLTIGSTLPLRTLENDPEVRRRIPGLWVALRAVGSVALRHRATLGGNLGRSAPSSDLIPILLALDASVELVGPQGMRSLSVDAFVRASRTTELGPAELIRAVRIPEARPSAYHLQRVRPFHDISHMAIAVSFSPGGSRWRIAVAGFPPRPLLVPEAEVLLTTAHPPEEAVLRAADAVVRHAPIVADKRASEEYRRQLVRPLLVRAVHQCEETMP
jgi:CO/xanthine dehydrogenase FAD-binding subunit